MLSIQNVARGALAFFSLLTLIGCGGSSSNDSANSGSHNTNDGDPGYLFLRHQQAAHGIELYRYDTDSGISLVKDINTNSSSLPSGFIQFNGKTYFTATGGTTGQELWQTDGTQGTTTLVKDINPGPAGSQPSLYGAVEYNGELYFSADGGTSGLGLWKTDGTTTGTVFVRNIGPASNADRIELRTVLNDYLIFETTDYSNRTKAIWRTDGATAGTIQLSSDVSYFAPQNLVYKNQYYFTKKATDGSLEYWRTDGTVAGTVFIQTIAPPRTFIGTTRLIVNNILYFNSNDAASGTELWRTDGTAEGTMRVADINPGAASSRPIRHTVMNGEIYFQANGGGSGIELWKTDGTQSGTVQVKDIQPGTGHSAPSNLFVSNGILYFTADDGVSGKELWRTEGTEASTIRVSDIAGDSSVYGLVAANNNVFFHSFDRTNQNVNLWVTDGTPTNTTMLTTLFTNTGYERGLSMTAFNENLYFSIKTSATGHEIWRSDGTVAGTEILADINPGSGNAINSRSGVYFIHYNDLLYFKADDGARGEELWQTDGTTEGTKIVKDINPITGGSGISSLPDLNNNQYFRGYNSVNGWELWRTDGTTAGTILVADIGTNNDNSNPSDTFEFNGEFYFSATDGTYGKELWKTDGTEANTVRVKDIHPGAGSSEPKEFVGLKGDLYFSARDGANSYGIWRTNGTEAGTVKVVDVHSTSGEYYPRQLTANNGGLYFTGQSQATPTNVELFFYDPETQQTQSLAELSNDFGEYSRYSKFAVANGRMLFPLFSDTKGWELWSTDGTPAGTLFVTILNENARSSSYDSPNLFAFNNAVYFGASDNTNGIRLLKTDGTPAGTTSVHCIQNTDVFAKKMNDSLYLSIQDCDAGRGLWRLDTGQATEVYSSNDDIGQLGVVLNNQLYFTISGAAGETLWKTDGTTVNTIQVSDINPNDNQDRIYEMVMSADSIYFTADDRINGRALWQSNGTAAGTSMITNSTYEESSSFSRIPQILNQESVSSEPR